MPRKPAPKPKNSNGEGSVYFEKSRNKWCASIHPPVGDRLRQRFDTKEEADEWLLLKRAEFAKGTYIPPSDLTFGEWLMRYLEMFRKPNMKAKSFDRLLQTAAHLAPLAEIELKSIEPFAIQRFYSEIPSDLASSSKKKICGLTKSCLKKAYALKLISEDVMLPVEPPKLDDDCEEVVVFTEEEISKILTTVQNSRYYSRYYTFVLLALTTGARLGELLGLKRNRLYDGYIKIDNNLQAFKSKLHDMPPKTKAGLRNITIPKKVEQLLRQTLYADKIIPIDGYIFHTRSGGPFAPRNMERTWKHILLEAELEHKKFHALRHTHATQLLAAGVPLLEVSKRLGHSSPAITLKLYGHAIPNYDHKVVLPAVERIYALN